MKKYKIKSAIIALAGLIVASCGNDFLTIQSTGRVEAGGPATEDAIQSAVVSAYQILLFDSYANYNYNSVLLMSDLRSDDIYKGGESAGDQRQLYDLAIFRSTSEATIGGLWSIYYTGIARCNYALLSVNNAVDGIDQNRLKRYAAEALFLRAYYGHLLWKFWGNVPYFTEALTEPFVSPQFKADEVYAKIMEDIKAAEDLNILPMKVPNGEEGRVSRAALLMLKARVVLYQKDASRYTETANDMASIITSDNYRLFDDFAAMWEESGEFCIESIFESNQLPQGKGWGAAWQGYGTNLPAYISPNNLDDPNGVFKGGWGFGPVRPSVLNIFENGDTRLEGSVNDWRGGKYNPRFQDTGLAQRKYAARNGYNSPPGDQDLNYANNLRIFRYAETLLNYAELVGVMGVAPQQGVNAQNCLNQVRNRAFKGTAPALPLNAENIKSERRKEFIGEGMRFWDLIRWGDAVRVLTETVTEATPGTEDAESVTWTWSRTFTEAKKYLPIPIANIQTTMGTEYPMEQNPGWD